MNKKKIIKGFFFLAIAFSFICLGAIFLTLLFSDKTYLFGSIGFLCLIIVFTFGFLGLKNILEAIMDE